MWPKAVDALKFGLKSCRIKIIVIYNCRRIVKSGFVQSFLFIECIFCKNNAKQQIRRAL